MLESCNIFCSGLLYTYNIISLHVLGGIKRNSNGQIISAKATEIKFHGLVNITESTSDDGTDMSEKYGSAYLYTP